MATRRWGHAAKNRSLVIESLETRLLLDAGGRPTPPGSVGQNIALGCSYEWSAAPNYATCTDSGDITQLTDGQYTSGYFWTRPSTVGWQATNPVTITVDLGVVQPIQGFSYHTAAYAAVGVLWPTAINVTVSNDNRTFYDVCDLVSLDPPPGGTSYVVRDFDTNAIATHGRYVKFEIVPAGTPSFTFVDEIKVFRGQNSLLGQNIALQKPYTLSPAPNYSGCTDPGDATQLTDGLYTSGYFWSQQSTVGWQTVQNPWVEITIDLQQDQPIEGISFNTAANSADVSWLRAINVLVSTDGVNFHDAGEAISLSVDHGLPPSGEYGIHSYWTDRLTTHGRYVKIVPQGAIWIYVDEIEIYRGRDAMLATPYSGSPVTGMSAFVEVNSQRSMEIRRIVLDAQYVQEHVNAAASMTATQRKELTAQLTSIIAQAMYHNPPANRVLPIDELHAQVYRVQAALWRSLGLDDLVAWATPSIWDPLDATQMPDGVLPDLDVTLMRNEFRAVAFNLSNTTDGDLEINLRIQGLPGGTNPSYVVVHEVAWIDAENGMSNATPLPTAGLGGSGYVIHVPSGMTRQVWMTFHPTDTTPGNYSGTVVVDAGAAGTINLPIAMRLSTLTFPDEPALGFYGWDYVNTLHYELTAYNVDAFIAELSEHYVNTTCATISVMPYPVNTTPFDNWRAQWTSAAGKEPDYYQIFINAGVTFAGYQMGTAQFNQAVATWISGYVAHWNAVGIDLSQIQIHLIDEPQTPLQAQILTNWINAIKAAEPEIPIWENPKFTNPAEYSAVIGACDIICAGTPLFMSREDAYRDFFTDLGDAGKSLNLYAAGGPMADMDPYYFGRVQAWTTFAIGGSAMGFWGFGDQRGSSSWKTDYPFNVVFSPLFLEPDAVTSGKTFEAMREGVEDYEYLRMLKDRIAELTALGAPAAMIEDAQDTLDTALAAVQELPVSSSLLYWFVDKDRNVADAQRILVLNQLEQLAAYPTIISDPADQWIVTGQTAAFTVQASGAVLNYQWQELINGNWQNISGATANSYTTAILSDADHGRQFRAVVSNSLGSVTSDAASLQTPGLAAWWKLDQWPGDSSGNGFHGSMVNGPVWSSGMIDGAITFDGLNDYLNVPTGQNLKYTGNDLTLSMWINVDTAETTGGDLLAKAWNSKGQYNYRLRLLPDGRLRFSLQGAAGYSVDTPSTLSKGEWHHVAATVHGATRTMTLYVDGVAVASLVHGITNWTPSQGDAGTSITMGTLYPYGSTWTGDQGLSFKGKLDDVRIYDRTLDAAEVLIEREFVAGPAVQSIVVNDGNAQRSKVNSLTIAFNTIVALDDGAFEVMKKGAGGGLVNVVVALMTVETRTVATLSFAGSFVEYGSLSDGEYQLTIRGDKIRNAATLTPLDGDGDGLAGGNRVFGAAAADKFFRKFGDSDGDRDVDSLDLARFRLSYMNPTRYLWYFDFEGDGDGDSLDLARFRLRYLV